jgi:hypothetical protein
LYGQIWFHDDVRSGPTVSPAAVIEISDWMPNCLGPPVPYAEVCGKYGIKDETTAANMLKTAKRLFRSILEKHVQQTVVCGEAAEEELQEIFGFLEHKRTG